MFLPKGQKNREGGGRRVYWGHLFEENEEEPAEGPRHGGTGREESEEAEERGRQAPP